MPSTSMTSAYLSYAKTTLVLEAFWGWSPSTETVEQWALGVGRQAAPYMASVPPLPLSSAVQAATLQYCGFFQE